MTPNRSSSIKKFIGQALLGLSVVAASNSGLAATAVVKVNISLPQVLTTSVSRDTLSSPSFDRRPAHSYFNDSKNNGHLVRSEHSEVSGNPVTYLYIQT